MRKLSIHIHVYLLCRYYLPTLHLRNQEKSRKFVRVIASMHVAHFCKNFSFFSENHENYKIYFFPFYFHFVSRKQTFILTPLNAGLFHYFGACRDTCDVTITFFGLCKNHLNLLPNQNKRNIITLIIVNHPVILENRLDWKFYRDSEVDKQRTGEFPMYVVVFISSLEKNANLKWFFIFPCLYHLRKSSLRLAFSHLYEKSERANWTLN